MASKRVRGKIIRFSKDTWSGRIRLDDGRLIDLPAAAVAAAGIRGLGLGDVVLVYVNSRFGRDVATGLIRESAAEQRARQSFKEKRQLDPDEFSVRERYDRETRILLVGRTGVGKSSTINALLGAEVASVGDFEPETAGIDVYVGQVGSLDVLLVDTPGLCDERPEHGNDDRYVDLMAERVGEVDLVLFVTMLDESRVRSDEIRAAELLTEAFGESLWENAVVVMTRADRVEPERLEAAIAGRTAALRRQLGSIARPFDDDVPYVPFSNTEERSPDGERWLGRLWISVLERLAAPAFAPMLLSLAERVEIEADPPPPKTRAERAARSEEERRILAPAQGSVEAVPKSKVKPSSTARMWSPPAAPKSGAKPSSKDASSGRASESVSVVQPPAVSGPQRAEAAVVETGEILPPEPLASAVGRLSRPVAMEGNVGGVHITVKNVNVISGRDPVVITDNQGQALRQVAEARAPGFLEKAAKSAGKWLAKKIGVLIGGL